MPRKKKQTVIEKMPLKYVAVIIGILLAACAPTPQHIAISSLLPTATLVGWEATPLPSATLPPTARPPTPTLEVPNQMVEVVTFFDVEVLWRGTYQGAERMINARNWPGMYLDDARLNPSRIVAYIRPYTVLWIEAVYTDYQGNKWARLAMQDVYITLIYNGVAYTTWDGIQQ